MCDTLEKRSSATQDAGRNACLSLVVVTDALDGHPPQAPTGQAGVTADGAAAAVATAAVAAAAAATSAVAVCLASWLAGWLAAAAL